MSIRQSNRFRLYALSLSILVLVSLNGCSLLWNAESVDTPPTERMRCGNQLDDDEDGLQDCFDEDCAWDELCLSGYKPYVISACAFGETQLSQAFDLSTVSRLANQCRNVQATSSFGGNRSVCGPANTARAGILSAEYHLNHWNVLADGYCTNLFDRILGAKTCDIREDQPTRACDAPALVCLDEECLRFGLFLNGNRNDGQSSGIVSRNSDVWFENTDFFEIDTSIRRLYRGLIDASFSDRGEGLLPCNSDNCSDTCNMEMYFEPKQSDVSGPRLSLSLMVNDEDQLSIQYAVNAGLGDDLFVSDGRALSGDCGAIDGLVGGSLEFGYGLRLSGPYYDRDSSGQLLPSLVVSKATESGEWVGLCAVPWLDNTGVTPQTEYQIKFTRDGLFNTGKLLLHQVNVKRRKRITGSRAICGPSDVAIFQGGRTVCEDPVQTIERVHSVARYFDDRARRLLIATSPDLGQYKAFEEIEGVLFELNADAGALPSLDDTLIGIETEDGALSDNHFRVWTLNAAGHIDTRRLHLVPDTSAAKGVSKLVVDEQGTVRLAVNELTDALVRHPSTIFRNQIGDAGYTWLSLTSNELIIAHSADGTTDWEVQERRTELYDVLRSRSGLEAEQIVDVTGLEVPSMQVKSNTQRILLLVTTQHAQTRSRTSHLLTLVREGLEWQTSNLFYHGEIAIDPVVLETEGDQERSTSCVGAGCGLNAGLIAMSLSSDARLSVYARTTIDASFRPQASLQPEAYCERFDRTDHVLPDTQVWRRLFYQLK